VPSECTVIKAMGRTEHRLKAQAMFDSGKDEEKTQFRAQTRILKRKITSVVCNEVASTMKNIGQFVT
jgi:hypothetical protein